MCDGHDIGISIDSGDEVAAPGVVKPQQIFVYDNYPGGIGFSAPLYQMHEELLQGTRRLIDECQCESGCPGCVGPLGDTGPLAKVAALRILNLLLGPTEDTAGTEDTEGARQLGPEEQPF